MGDVPFDFDIDHYINRFIPRPRLHLLPQPISWFLGYRSKTNTPIGTVLVWWWSFIGAFAGLLVVEAVFRTQGIKDHGAPTVIASLGAAAILEYNTIDSPLSQPRNAILGQLFASILSVGITKLFQLHSNFEDLRWIAGALSVGITSAFMGFTKTVHPPAGATALLAATTPEITELGWFYVPLVSLGSVLLIAVACVLNNIQRRFPIYWWTAVDLSRPKGDIERQVAGDGKKTEGEESCCHEEEYRGLGKPQIMINDRKITIPDWISLDSDEVSMLEVLRLKLQEGRTSASSIDTDELKIMSEVNYKGVQYHSSANAFPALSYIKYHLNKHGPLTNVSQDHFVRLVLEAVPEHLVSVLAL